MFQFKRIILFLLILSLSMIPYIVFAEDSSPEIFGEWVFGYNPSNTVIVLNADGSALYGGQNLVWEDTDSGILLTDDQGASLALRYELSDTGLILYLPSLYTRISEIGAEGEILGTWKSTNENSQSSFIFTEEGTFLEDGFFSGTYTDDPEIGHVLLHYSADFEETDFWYAFTDDGYLYVAYPWKLIRK